MKQHEETLPCTPPGAKFVCSPAEVSTHRKYNLDHTLQFSKTQETLNELYEEI